MQYQDFNTDKLTPLKGFLLAATVVTLVAAFSFYTHNDSNYVSPKHSGSGKSINISNDKRLIQPSGDSSILGKPSGVQIQPAAETSQSTQNSQLESGGMYYSEEMLYPKNSEPCKPRYSERPCIIPPP